MTAKLLLGLVLILISVSTYSQDILKMTSIANEKGKNGKCIEAIHDYNQILSIKPNFSIAIVMKGLCYSQLGVTDSACICFIDGIEMGSKNSENYYPKYCKDYKPKVDINNFKIGRFKYLSNNSDTSAYFVRDSKFQTEFFENSKYQSKFGINWTSDFEYELKFIETNDPNLSFLKKGDKVKVKVLKTDKDKYVYCSELNGMISYGKHMKINN